MVQSDMRSPQDIFQHLSRLIPGERFLKMQGLNNEVPFFICPFNPKDTVEMEELITQLVNRLANQGIQVLDINLYDLSISLLQQRGIFEQLLDVEAETPKDQLLELLQNVLDPAAHLVPAIAGRIGQTPHDVLFITGVGAVFPYIRSHNVLNNLQKVAKDRPTLMFFPGKYTQTLASGASLDLFGLLHDDKYYRAFNILDIQI